MENPSSHGGIALPAPTPWPVVLALGVTLLGAGYLMHPLLAVIGSAVVVLGCVGWFRNVLPVEHEEIVSVVEHAHAARAAREVPCPALGAEGHRMHLPFEVYPYSAGVKAGLAGGAAMAIVGCVFGLVTHGMQGFDYESARSELNIPEGFRVEAMIAVGHPGDPAQLPEKMREREAPSGRKSLAEITCEGAFNF